MQFFILCINSGTLILYFSVQSVSTQVAAEKVPSGFRVIAQAEGSAEVGRP